MLTPGELVSDLRQKGLVREKYAVKKWVWLTAEEHALIKATAKALGMAETQVIRALILRSLGKEKGPTSG